MRTVALQTRLPVDRPEPQTTTPRLELTDPDPDPLSDLREAAAERCDVEQTLLSEFENGESALYPEHVPTPEMPEIPDFEP